MRVKQAEWVEVAREFLCDLSDGELQEATVWKLMDCFRINRSDVAEQLLLAERLRRELVTMRDLPPYLRRKVVDPDHLDLHALASGPIMDPGAIYLPAGKLSMEETRAREAAQVRAA